MSALHAAKPRIAAQPVSARDRLIVALDVPSVAEAREMVRKLEGVAAFFKLGPWLMLAEGGEALIGDLVKNHHDLFLDSKSQDIPETMRAGVATAARRGIRFLTIHGSDEVSDEAMEAAASAKSGRLQLLCVTVLTSLNQGDLAKAGHPDLKSLAVARAARAMRCGCDGVIASAHEARPIKDLAREKGRPGFLVVSPGIRPSGAGAQDHKRAATPRYAIEEGADYLVVGRPIVRAPNPAEAALSLVAEMQDAFDRLSGSAE